MVVHMLSPDNTFDQLYVSNYARNNVRDELLRLNGVGDLTIFGERQYSLRIWLDPDKLAAFGMTSGDVVKAIQEQNVQVSGGALGQEPVSKGSAFQLTVTTQGRFNDPRQFRGIIVRSTPDGRLVRVQDVARVELGAQDYFTNSYLDGKPAVALAIFQRPATNALDTAGEIIATMNKLKQNFPPGLDYQIVYNPTDFIRESVREVYKTLFEAVLLVVIVVIVFLQSWRTAIIPIIAIPVSLIGTFAAMTALGFSLNTLTLFGLVLAIGIVVDDAIVVVENVEHNIEEGMAPRAAAHKTMDDVGGALVAIALVLVAVFVPTAFIPGISGQFYRQFALTIAVSTVISAFVSLTLSPALAAILLKPIDRRSAAAQSRRPAIRLAGRRVQSRLRANLERLCANASASWCGARSSCCRSMPGCWPARVWAANHVPSGFIPALDQGYAIVIVQLPDGASLSRTDAVVRRVSDIARDTPGALHAVAFAGFSAATFTNATNAAAVFVPFKPFEERLKAGQTGDSIIKDLFGRMQAVEEAFIIVVAPPPVRGIGSTGGFQHAGAGEDRRRRRRGFSPPPTN